MAFHEPAQAPVQFPHLPAQLPDAPGRRAPRDPGGLQHHIAAPVFVVAGEPRAGETRAGLFSPASSSRRTGLAVTRTALSWLIAWGRALTAEPLASLNILAICTGPSPDLARARARPVIDRERDDALFRRHTRQAPAGIATERPRPISGCPRHFARIGRYGRPRSWLPAVLSVRAVK